MTNHFSDHFQVLLDQINGLAMGAGLESCSVPVKSFDGIETAETYIQGRYPSIVSVEYHDDGAWFADIRGTTVSSFEQLSAELGQLEPLC
ncbi:hypothetical protein [Vibrio sp.]|uniref:hypothetical protein n=1 Tax=Vibrio sp. TaxID=678 RepID=UPI003D0C7543